MPQKVGKKLPKRTTSAHAKEYRANAWKTGEARKAERVKEQDNQHAANVAAGKTSKVRRRPRKDNMRLCMRCQTRIIVAGSVCWCKSIGADLESRRNSR